MHRHDAAFGQQVIQKAEDGLLVFARILRSRDQNQLLLHMKRDNGFRAAAVLLRIGLETGAIDDREFGNIFVKLATFRATQHVADEQVVPGEFVDHPNIQPVRGMNDVLPGDAAAWAFVESSASDLLDGYGYTRIRTPAVERTELFKRSIGEATDIVEKEM